MKHMNDMTFRAGAGLPRRSFLALAAGAVADAMAASVSTTSIPILSGATKWAINKAPRTKRDPPKASKAVMTRTRLPKVLIVETRKEVPMEKAMKPRATLETHFSCETYWKMMPSLMVS